MGLLLGCSSGSPPVSPVPTSSFAPPPHPILEDAREGWFEQTAGSGAWSREWRTSGMEWCATEVLFTRSNFLTVLKKLPLRGGGGSRDRNHQMALKLGDSGTLNKV